MKGSSLPTSWPQTGSISSRATVQKLAIVIARWERQSGTQIEDATLNERYAALMPDLRETLAYARQITSAARTTKSDDSGALPASRPEDSRSSGPMVPGYEITAAVDHGGQGLVYKAIQDSTGKVVALKLLLDGPLSSERQRRRFTREVEIISRLSHPNIVPLLDSGSAHGRQYFAMEYIDGLPIDDYFLLNRGSLDGLVSVFEKVCRAVASAHQAGVIHRDLKPGNILVDAKGEPHILDFGLAKEFGDETDDEPRSLLSYTGQILGTLPYLSPEQAAAEPQIDVRSDIYSLGVILYELVTGMPPYDTSGDPEVARRNIRFTEPRGFEQAAKEANPLLSTISVPNDLQRVILKAMSKEKTRRYQSTIEFADDLSRFLRGEAVSAKADSALYVLRKTLKRYRTQAIVAACFVFVLIGSAVGMGVMWLRADRLAKSYQTGLELGSYLHLATVRRDEGRVDDAIRMLQTAAQLGVGISSRDSESLRFAFETHQRLTELLLDCNRVNEAKEQSREALRLAGAGTEAHPKDVEWKRFSGIAAFDEGRVELAEKRYDEAMKSLNTAATLQQSLLDCDKENQSLLADLGGTYQVMGKTSRLQKRQREGYTYSARADEVFEHICRVSPGSADYIIKSCMAKLGMAAWHLDQKDDENNREAAFLLATIKVRLDKLESENPQHGLNRDVARLRDAIAFNSKIIEKRNLTSVSQVTRQ